MTRRPTSGKCRLITGNLEEASDVMLPGKAVLKGRVYDTLNYEPDPRVAVCLTGRQGGLLRISIHFECGEVRRCGDASEFGMSSSWNGTYLTTH